MNIKPFAVVAVLLGLAAAPVAAQVVNVEERTDAQEFRAKIAAAKQNDAYAKYVVCDGLPDAAEMGKSVRFYTRLDGVGPREALPEEGKGSSPVSAKEAPKDETRLDDYASQGVTRAKLHINEWSCDTQDYTLTFDMDGLVRASQKTSSQPVKGHAHVETRGQTDFEGDLACTAFW